MHATLRYGGSKNLMGYNKIFTNNSFVLTDFTPAAHAGLHIVGSTWPPEGKPGACSAIVTGTAFARELDLQDQWWGNTCISNTSRKQFHWCVIDLCMLSSWFVA